MRSERLEEQAGGGWRAALSREELRDLLTVKDGRAWASLAVNWALVGAAVALVGAWPNPLTVVAALFVIGGRQLACAAVMHDAAHRSLFRSRRLNDWAGNWLAAYPVWSDLHSYRDYHLQHHARTGRPDDPDIGLVRPFPVTRRSLGRKVWRDLSGQTGRKFARAAWKRTFGRARTDVHARRAAVGVVGSNALLFAVLALAGHPALYLLWPTAWMTTYTLVTRVRSIAEHALTPDADDPLNNTRTVLARWWERLLVAPNRLNYHLEHHLLMTVPHYHLPRLHRLLRARGVLDGACVDRSYLGILARASAA